MSKEIEFQFEYQEKYYGSEHQVREKINYCNHCGHELIFSHLPDYKNLILQETAKCMKCGKGSRKLIHIIN